MNKIEINNEVKNSLKNRKSRSDRRIEQMNTRINQCQNFQSNLTQVYGLGKILDVLSNNDDKLNKRNEKASTFRNEREQSLDDFSYIDESIDYTIK